MKTIFYITIALLFISCSKEEETPKLPPALYTVTLTTTCQAIYNSGEPRITKEKNPIPTKVYFFKNYGHLESNPDFSWLKVGYIQLKNNPNLVKATYEFDNLGTLAMQVEEGSYFVVIICVPTYINFVYKDMHTYKYFTVNKDIQLEKNFLYGAVGGTGQYQDW